MKRLAFTMNISDVSVLHPSRVNEWIKRAAPQIHGFCAFIRLLDWWTSCLWNGQSNSVPFWKYRGHEMLGEEDVILQWCRINMEITAWNVNLIACSNEGAGKSIKLASLLYIWYRGYSDIKGSKRTLYEVGKCFRNWWKHKKWRDFVSLHLLWENILQTGNILIDCCSIKNIGIALKTWGLKSVGCFWGEVCWGVGEQGIHHFITELEAYKIHI